MKIAGTLILISATLLLIGLVQWGWNPSSTESSFLTKDEQKTDQRAEPSIAQPPTLEIDPCTISSYLPGEDVSVGFTLRNVGSKPIYLSSFPPMIKISRPDQSDEVVRTFPAGKENIELKPHENYTYTLVWDQCDEYGSQVVPGSYSVEIYNIHAEGSELKVTGTIFPDGYQVAKVLIEYPQGAMEKRIEVNQSETVNNLTVTLQYVELSDTEAKVYTLAEIPGSTVHCPPGLPISKCPPPNDIDPVAWYMVDDYPEQEAIDVGFRMSERGVSITFGFNPVPSDAKGMIFKISKFGNRTGPWEFYIPLDNQLSQKLNPR